MLLFIIHAGFALQNKNWQFIRGSQTMENIRYVNCDFWDRRANLENDIASEKRPQNQNAFIKINDLGVILLGKEFYTQECTQLFHSVPSFLEIIDRKCWILSGPPCICHFLSIMSFINLPIIPYTRVGWKVHMLNKEQWKSTCIKFNLSSYYMHCFLPDKM